MRRNLVVVVALAAVLLSVAGARPADAKGQNEDGHAGGGTNPDGGQVIVIVPGSSSGGYVGTGYQGGGGSASTIECKYFEVTSSAGAVLPGIGTHITDASQLEEGTYVWLICRDTTTGDLTYQNIFPWDPANPPVLTPSAATLAQMAANSMRLPVPDAQSWPRDGTRGLVNLPVWLRVGNWEPVTASASAGGLTATVEAVPVRAEWDMDAGSVTCTDAGATYGPATRPDPWSSSCSYTYTRSSGSRPDLTYHNAVTVIWHLRWWATNGQGGDLGELASPSSAFTLQIEESQALVASAGT